MVSLTIENKWMEANSKFYRELLKAIKVKIASIDAKIGDAGEGMLRFYLSGGTLSDFFRGWVSLDCTRNDTGDYDHFNDTQAWVMDPAAFKFKVMEKNRWVGNIYSRFAFKDKDGKFYLYWDMFQMNLFHYIADKSPSEVRLEMSSKVIKQLAEWLGSVGFDYLLISGTPR